MLQTSAAVLEVMKLTELQVCNYTDVNSSVDSVNNFSRPAHSPEIPRIRRPPPAGAAFTPGGTLSVHGKQQEEGPTRR